jgi:oligopeptide transport system permease protein
VNSFRPRTARFAAWAICALVFVVPEALPFAPPGRADLNARNRSPSFAARGERSAEVRPWLGTDDAGRCLLSRLVHATRISLAAALGGGAVCLLIGGGVGVFAGWRGGATDLVVMRVVDAADALPTLAVVVMAQAWVRAASGPNGSATARGAALAAVLGGATWFVTARLVRAKTRWLKSQGFVEAALAGGIPPRRAVVRHVLPNLVPVLSAAAANAVPRLVLFEAFLSFLGLGVEPPNVSLGTLARQGFEAFSAVSPRPGPLLLPCAAVTAVVLLARKCAEPATGACEAAP